MSALYVSNHLINPWFIEGIEHERGKNFAWLHTSSGRQIRVDGEDVNRVLQEWQREVWPSTSTNPPLKDITTAVMNLVPISDMVPREEVMNVLRAVLAPGTYTEELKREE